MWRRGRILDTVVRALWGYFSSDIDSKITYPDTVKIGEADRKRITDAFLDAVSNDTSNLKQQLDVERAWNVLDELKVNCGREYVVRPTHSLPPLTDSHPVAHVVEPSAPKRADSETDSRQGFPVVSFDPPQVVIHGTAYALKRLAATFFNALVTASGDWINGQEVVPQASRVVASMPDQVRKLVESAPGKGYRLRREE